jgi:ABC-type Mn2+/Zn2+ transport system permease subunit
MVAAGLACAAVVLGLVLSAYANAVTGPAIVLSAAFLFVLTLLRPQAN